MEIKKDSKGEVCKMKNYRVFMVRIFRNVKSFEVKAESQKEAEKMAKKYANNNCNPYELLFNSVDNGFCEVHSVEIKKLGCHISDKTKPFCIKRVFKDDSGAVYIRNEGEFI